MFTNLTPMDMKDAMVQSLCNRMDNALKIHQRNLPKSRADELETHIQRICSMHPALASQVNDLQQSACSIEVWHDTSCTPWHMFPEDATIFLRMESMRYVVWRFIESCNASAFYELAYDDATGRWYVVGASASNPYIQIEDEPWTQPGTRCFWNVTRTLSPRLLSLPHLEAWLHRLCDNIGDHPSVFQNAYTF